MCRKTLPVDILGKNYRKPINFTDWPTQRGRCWEMQSHLKKKYKSHSTGTRIPIGCKRKSESHLFGREARHNLGWCSHHCWFAIIRLDLPPCNRLFGWVAVFYGIFCLEDKSWQLFDNFDNFAFFDNFDNMDNFKTCWQFLIFFMNFDN